jgi:type II secretory pathway component PulF
MNQYRAIIVKEIYTRRWSLLGFTFASVAFLLLYVLIYPSFQSQAAQFDKLLQAYPKAVLKAFNIDQLQISNAAGYISAEHFSFVWPLLAIFFSHWHCRERHCWRNRKNNYGY